MKYIVTATYNCSGINTVTTVVEAESEEEAIELMKEGNGDVISEEPDIMIEGNPYDIEVEVSE